VEAHLSGGGQPVIYALSKPSLRGIIKRFVSGLIKEGDMKYRGVLVLSAAIACMLCPTANGQLLQRQGNRIFWNGADAGRLLGTNLLIYLNGRNTQQCMTDIENIRSLGANLVRLNVHPGEYKTNSDVVQRLSDLTRFAAEQGVFPIIDYHGIGLPDGAAEQPGWDPTGDIYNSSFDLAKEFWQLIASNFKGHGYVIFELWNEPVDLDGVSTRDQLWPAVLSGYWQQLIDIIRAEGAQNFILAAGGHWARNTINYDQAPLSDPADNFGFAYHEYEWGEPQNAAMFLGGIQDEFPIIGTEWGLDNNSRNPSRAEFISFEDTFLDQTFVGWTAWVWSTSSSPCILTSYSFSLNNYGEYVRDKLNAASITARPDGSVATVSAARSVSLSPVLQSRAVFPPFVSLKLPASYAVYDLQGRKIAGKLFMAGPAGPGFAATPCVLRIE
jgi:hypothetical protein